jgi:hypothetical protein
MKRTFVLCCILIALCTFIFSCKRRSNKPLAAPVENDSLDRARYDSMCRAFRETFHFPNRNIVAAHRFSADDEPDSFHLMLFGQTVRFGSVVLSVVDPRGREIFADTFDAFGLLGDLDDLPNTMVQEDTILYRFAHYFDDQNFEFPAAQCSGTYNGNDSTENADWEIIKEDTSAVSFCYSHGYEGTYWIAYSRKMKKVVTYLSMD